MKLLVVGGGGREHALAWKAARSPLVDRVYVAPGNAGTAREKNIENLAVTDSSIGALANFAKDESIDLTIVGPENPLVQGIVDVFAERGLRCFGPTAKAAQLEGSKGFAKDFLARNSIPTADYKIFTDAGAAKDYIREIGIPLVIKADGLAAGKGVIIAQSEADAFSSVDNMLSGAAFGKAGQTIVIEEMLQGEEASFIVMTDGKNILPLATSQDHKTRDNGDKGPNTGGMGAYSPAPVLTDKVYQRTMKEVIEPTVKGMAEEGIPYIGFLYAGLMIQKDGTPKVLEYNCRFGDPETQPIILRLDSDLVELCLAALEGRLNEVDALWDERASLGVVMAAGGYPIEYRKGDVIEGLEALDEKDYKVFHAGTRLQDGKIVTNGGRVLCVTALGEKVSSARDRAYEIVKKIDWKDVYYRTDIGHRAIAREAGTGRFQPA